MAKGCPCLLPTQPIPAIITSPGANTHAGHCFKFLLYPHSFNPHDNLAGGYCYYPYFRHGETEAQRRLPLEPRSEPRQLSPESLLYFS